MGKKLAAWIIALVVIAFPFRRAFLSDQEPGLMMMASFILTLIGIGVFTYLIVSSNKTEVSH